MSLESKYIRWVDEIGMFAVDRSIPESCIHATDFCRVHCYNDKLYKVYPAMHGRDVKNETAWREMDPIALVTSLDRRELPTDRFRLMTRGEAFATPADVDTVLAVASAMPDRLLWVPTRGWRDPMVRALVESDIAPLPNVALLASLDPSNTESEWRDLVSANWSTMYFGDDSGWTGPPNGFDCPKTTPTRKHPRGIKGHCGVCKAGCFAGPILGRRVDVILREH